MRIKSIDTTNSSRARESVKPTASNSAVSVRVERVSSQQGLSDRSDSRANVNRLHEQYREQTQTVYREKPLNYQSAQALRGYSQTANFDKKVEIEEIFKVDVIV